MCEPIKHLSLANLTSGGYELGYELGASYPIILESLHPLGYMFERLWIVVIFFIYLLDSYIIMAS